VSDGTLHIAEIPFEDGTIRFRYSRFLSEDGASWIRHGPYTAYHSNGKLASEGTYDHGREHGLWKDFHEDGSLAAEGQYEQGEEVGEWQYFDKI
jgi:antitoxin component YwqK of YwqJK toxin-antitoxin module